MSFNILNLLGELSENTDKVIQECESPSVEEWLKLVKQKVLDIQSNVQPTSSLAIPNCLKFIKGSSGEQYRSKVSAVFPFLGKGHLHGRKSAKCNTSPKIQILDNKQTSILTNTEKKSPSTSNSDKAPTAIKDSKLDHTFIKSYSIEEISTSCSSEMKQGNNGSLLLTKQGSSKQLSITNLGVQPIVCLDDIPNDIRIGAGDIKKTTVAAVDIDKTCLINKGSVVDENVKKVTAAKQNKRKRDGKTEITAKHEKNPGRSLSQKSKNTSEKNQTRSLSYKRKNAENLVKDIKKISKPKMDTRTNQHKSSVSEVKVKTSYSSPKKFNAITRSKTLKSTKEAHSSKGSSSLTKSVYAPASRVKNKLLTKTRSKAESSELNKTYVSTGEKIISDVEVTASMTNNCKSSVSIQNSSPNTSVFFSVAATEDKKIVTPTGLNQTKESPTCTSQSGRSSSKRKAPIERAESSELNKTYVSTGEKTVLGAEITASITNYCSSSVSIQNSPCTFGMSFGATKDKELLTPTELIDIKVSPGDASLSGRSTSEKTSSIKKKESPVLNKTYISTGEKVVTSAEVTSLTTNYCTSSVSMQSDSPYSSVTSSFADTEDKSLLTLTALNQTKVSPISTSESSKSSLEKKSSIESCEQDTGHTSVISYDISEIHDSDDEVEVTVKKPIPSWARGLNLKNALLHQHYNPTVADDLCVEIYPTVDLETIFGIRKTRYFKRTSSAIWSSPSSFTEDA